MIKSCSKKILIIIHFFIFPILTTAQDVDQLMNEANNYYQNSQFEQAINIYNRILDEGYISSALYYNLGNSYYRFGELGKSILYFERALKLSPNDEDIKYNLRVVNARTVDQITEVPQIFLVEWWNILITSLPLSGWLIIVSVFYILFIFSIGVYLFSRKASMKKFSLIFGSFNLFVLVLSALLTWSNYRQEHSSEYGILLQSTISVKSSPGNQSEDAFVIHEGVKFKIEDEVDEWSKIKLADGKLGWMPNSAFEKI